DTVFHNQYLTDPPAGAHTYTEPSPASRPSASTTAPDIGRSKGTAPRVSAFETLATAHRLCLARAPCGGAVRGRRAFDPRATHGGCDRARAAGRRVRERHGAARRRGADRLRESPLPTQRGRAGDHAPRRGRGDPRRRAD